MYSGKVIRKSSSKALCDKKFSMYFSEIIKNQFYAQISGKVLHKMICHYKFGNMELLVLFFVVVPIQSYENS